MGNHEEKHLAFALWWGLVGGSSSRHFCGAVREGDPEGTHRLWAAAVVHKFHLIVREAVLQVVGIQERVLDDKILSSASHSTSKHD